MARFIYVYVIKSLLATYAHAQHDPRIVTPNDFYNPTKIAGKVVRVDTYFEANHSEYIIAKGCTGVLVYANLEPGRGVPIYAVATAGQCCNINAALYKTNLKLSEYEHVSVSPNPTTGIVRSFRALKINAHISYGSNFLPVTTVMVIKGTLRNQMVTVHERRLLEATCSRRLGTAFEYRSVNDFCVIHVDPRIHRRVVPLLTVDNFHHITTVREEKTPKNCSLVRWNDNENYRELEELEVNIVETKLCQTALSYYDILLAPDNVLRSYCIQTPNHPDVKFMKDINNTFVHLHFPMGQDFSDVGTPVVCKTNLGQNRNDVEFLLGLATLKVKDYTVVMDGLRIKSHLSVQYLFKRIINPSYLLRPLAMTVKTYTHKHEPVTTVAATTAVNLQQTSLQPTNTDDTTPTGELSTSATTK